MFREIGLAKAFLSVIADLQPRTTGKSAPKFQEFRRNGSKTAADAARLFGMHRSNITRLLAGAGRGISLRRLAYSRKRSSPSVVVCVGCFGNPFVQRADDNS